MDFAWSGYNLVVINEAVTSDTNIRSQIRFMQTSLPNSQRFKGLENKQPDYTAFTVNVTAIYWSWQWSRLL